MSGHSPTPWRLEPPRQRGGPYRLFDNDPDAFAVLQLYGPEARENARLFYVAPDLLEACLMTLAFIEDGYGSPAAVENALREALEKAEGSRRER